jgi:hypothetical protein
LLSLLLTGELATAVWKRSYPSALARILALSEVEQRQYHENVKLGYFGKLAQSTVQPDKKGHSNAEAIAMLLEVSTWQGKYIWGVERKGQGIIADGVDAGTIRVFGFDAPRRFTDHAIEIPQGGLGSKLKLDWAKGELTSSSLRIVEVRFLASIHVEGWVNSCLDKTVPRYSPTQLSGDNDGISSFKPRSTKGPGRPSKGNHTEFAIRQLIDEGSFDLQGVATKQMFKIRERMLLNDPSLDVTADKLSDQTIGRVVARIKEEIVSKLNIPDEY